MYFICLFSLTGVSIHYLILTLYTMVMKLEFFNHFLSGKIISSDLFTYKNMVDRIAKNVGGKCPVLEKNAENGVVLKNFTDFGCRVGKGNLLYIRCVLILIIGILVIK